MSNDRASMRPCSREATTADILDMKERRRKQVAATVSYSSSSSAGIRRFYPALIETIYGTWIKRAQGEGGPGRLDVLTKKRRLRTSGDIDRYSSWARCVHISRYPHFFGICGCYWCDVCFGVILCPTVFGVFVARFAR